MCENSKKLSVTVDTTDVVALLEVGRMFAAIADQRIDARAALVTAPGPGAALSEAAEAFQGVEDGARVDAGAAFATAAAQPAPTEGAALAGTTAGPGAGIQPGVPGLGGTASPANLTPVNQAGGAPAPGVELDKNNMPWDARINTSNKAKTQAGVWKRVPKITDEFYAQVLAELKGVMNGAPAAPVAGTTAPPPGPGAPDAGTGAAAPPPPAGTTAGPAPGPAGPDAAGPGAPADEPVPADFPGFLSAVSKRTMCNPPKLTQPEITTALQVVGAMNGCTLGSLSDLNVRADLIPAAFAELKKIWDAKP